MSRNALAVFVKMPDPSSVNKYLAEEIGEARALEIYRLCIDSMRKTLSFLTEIKTYWVVNKEEALDDPLWHDYERLWPGDRELGEAQYHIYQTLRNKHKNVVIIGVECPQISTYMLYNSFALLQDHEYIIGPANRGNYYLFGGSRDMPLKSWTSVHADKNYKMRHLTSNLPSQALLFGERSEIHTKKDLLDVIRQMPLIPHAGQRAFIDVAQNILSESL